MSPAQQDPNKVNGRSNGDLVGTWRAWSYGAICFKMLTLHHILKRAKN